MSQIAYRRLALACIMGLIIAFVVYGFSRTPEQRTIALLFTALPLVLPIRGTWSGSRYTIGYSSLLSTWYFCLSGWLYIVHLDWVRWLMLISVVLSLLWFFACLMHNKKQRH